MVTKAEMKAVVSLQDKRARDQLDLYVVEGDKLVREALALGLAVESVYAEKTWIHDLPLALAGAGARIVEVTAGELRRLSAQVTPHEALAVLRKPHFEFDWEVIEPNLVLVLEGIQDPGNLGSLLRVAAWFGVADLIASPDSADPFNPKAVQAGMGALFHVRVHSLDVLRLVADARGRRLPVYAATLGGESIYEAELEPRGFLLLGNESSGLSAASLALASRELTIPAWRRSGPGLDSLNVAAAAGILCSEFRRRARRSFPGQMHERP